MDVSEWLKLNYVMLRRPTTTTYVVRWQPAIEGMSYREAVKAMAAGSYCPVCGRPVVKGKRVVWRNKSGLVIRLVVVHERGSCELGRLYYEELNTKNYFMWGKRERQRGAQTKV
jgi:hypothetical protein